MPEAPKRLIPDLKPLTRSEKRVLDHIAMCRDARNRLVQSARHIAEATFLSHRAVQLAVNRLNELQLIHTLTGSVNRTSEHIFINHAPGLLNPGKPAPETGPPSGRSPRVRIKAAAGGAR